jgi:xylulokinase
MARLFAAVAPNKCSVNLLTLFGISLEIIPSVAGPGDCVGRVVADLPSPSNCLRGVPVFCCSHDTWSGVVGLGMSLCREPRGTFNGTLILGGLLSFVFLAAVAKLALATGVLCVLFSNWLR